MIFYKLTRREKEVVRLVRTGETYKIVADKLYVTEKTIQKHIENVYQKARVTNKTEMLNKLTQNQ